MHTITTSGEGTRTFDHDDDGHDGGPDCTGTVTRLAEHPGASADQAGGTTLEALAHAVLRLVGEHPGQLGRLRTARATSGRVVQGIDDVHAARLARYGVSTDLPLRSIVELVDAMIDGGLVHRTGGPRPVLVLTRAGHHALDALEATRG